MGVYGHGIFWIGTDEEEGKRQADYAANADCDDYHDWELRAFKAPNNKEDYNEDGWDFHKLVYTNVRSETT